MHNERIALKFANAFTYDGQRKCSFRTSHKEMLKKSAKKVLKRVPKKGFQKKVQEKVEKTDLKKCK